MSKIAEYWTNGFHNVQGWVSSELIRYIDYIGEVQNEAGIRGNLAEIGVYHGKFLLALSCLLNDGEKCTALDVFDDQERNIDGAGAGNLDILKENIDKHGSREVDWNFIKQDSSDLTLLDQCELIRNRGPFRLFSVDGCHTFEHTLNDLRTAQNCIGAGGVIILDDYMQPHWPGVTQAVHVFCAEGEKFKPFLYAHQKLFLVNVGWHEHFYHRFAARFIVDQVSEVKSTTMFGVKCVSVYP